MTIDKRDHQHSDHSHTHGVGHNHSHDHMHSHVHFSVDKEHRDKLQALAKSFIEGFRKADDKPAFLELVGIKTSRQGKDGLTLHLVDTAIESKWQLGTASPAFCSKELIYMPYPAQMVGERETMTFTYVSLTERCDLDLITLLDEIYSKAPK